MITMALDIIIFILPPLLIFQIYFATAPWGLPYQLFKSCCLTTGNAKEIECKNSLSRQRRVLGALGAGQLAACSGTTQ